MAIVKLEYPVYSNWDKDIEGKVLVATPTVGYTNDMLRLGRNYEKNNYRSNLVTGKKGLIIGKATGNIRTNPRLTEPGWLIEIEQYLPSLDRDTGIPYKHIEVYSPFEEGLNPVSSRWFNEDDQFLKGCMLLFSTGPIGSENAYRDGVYVPQPTSYYHTIHPWMYSHTPKTEYDHWLKFFNIKTPAQESPEVNFLDLNLDFDFRIKDMQPPKWDGTLSSDYWGRQSATHAEFEPTIWFNGYYPQEVRVIADTSSGSDINTPGIKISTLPSDSPYNTQWSGKGFSMPSLRIYNLTPSTTYYVQTVIKGHPYVYDTANPKNNGYNNDITHYYYSNELEYTTPSFELNPILVPVLVQDVSHVSAKILVRFEWLGDKGPITEAGICYNNMGVGFPPTTADSKVTTAMRHERSADWITLSGLASGATYRFRTYVIAGGTTYYSDEDQFYDPWVSVDPVGGWVIWGGGYWLSPRDGVRAVDTIVDGVKMATFTTKGSSKRKGEIMLDRAAPVTQNTESGAVVNFKIVDTGNYSVSETEIGLVWCESNFLDTYEPIIGEPGVTKQIVDPFEISERFDISDTISYLIESMESNKLYRVRAYISNPSGLEYSGYGHILATKASAEDIYKLSGIEISEPKAEKVGRNSAEVSVYMAKKGTANEVSIAIKEGVGIPSISDAISTFEAKTGTITAIAEDLKPGTLYSVKAYVTTDTDTVESTINTFRTQSSTTSQKPIISNSTGPARPQIIGDTFADFYIIENSATSIPLQNSATDIGVVYSINPISVEVHPDSSTATKYTNKYYSFRYGNDGAMEHGYRIEGLQPNQLYWIAGFAKNGSEYSYTTPIKFKTDINVGSIEVVSGLSFIQTESSISTSIEIKNTHEVTKIYQVYSYSSFDTSSINVDSLPAVVYKQEVPTTYLDKWDMAAGKQMGLGSSITGLLAGQNVYYAIYAKNTISSDWSDLKMEATKGTGTPFLKVNATMEPSSATVVIKGNVETNMAVSKIYLRWDYGHINDTSWLENIIPMTLNADKTFEYQFNADKTSTSYTFRVMVEATNSITEKSATFNWKSSEGDNPGTGPTPGPVPVDSGKFNPPYDPLKKSYIHTYDGVTRVWRRNKEGHWERDHSKTVQYNNYTLGGSASSVSDRKELRAQIESGPVAEDVISISPNYHETRSYTKYGIDGSSFALELFLGEDLKFTGPGPYECDIFSNSAGYEGHIYEYHPGKNSLTTEVLLADSETIDEILGYVDSGFSLKILEAGSSEGYRLIPTLNAKLYGNSIYIDAYSRTLDEYTNDLIIPSSASPSNPPQFIGQRWIDSSNKMVYTATGTSSLNDWLLDTDNKYKIYEAVVTQEGLDAPTAIVLRNTIYPAMNPIWTRDGQGLYTLSFAASIPGDVYLAQNNSIYRSPGGMYYLEYIPIGAGQFQFNTVDVSTGLKDGKMDNLYIKLMQKL